MSDSKFESDLAAELAKAKAKLDADEQTAKTIEAKQREERRAIEDQFQSTKSKAIRFNQQKLAALFRKTQNAVSEKMPEYAFDGDYVENEGELRGTVGKSLLNGKARIDGTLAYSIDTIRIQLVARTPSGKICFSDAVDLPAAPFNEEVEASWFEERLTKAVGALIATGELTKHSVVRYRDG